MKNAFNSHPYLYLCFFFLGLATNTTGQIFTLPTGSNFYDYLEAARTSSFYSDDDTLEGGFKSQHDRIALQWGSRLYPHGDFMVANRAIIDYAQNYQYVPSNIDPNWICVGPSNTPVNNDYRGVGQIHRIAFDPNYGISNQTVYASSGFGGLWRSEDDGYNWVNVNTDHLPMTTVADVAVCPTNGNILYIGTGLPDGGVNLTYSSNWAAINPIFTIGVYRSTDYGATWHSINEGLMDDFYTNGGVIRKMEIDKYNPDIIIMATSNGVYKTSNALSTNPEWTKIFDGFTDDDNDFRVVKYKPGSSNVMYAASNNIFKSADGGTTWASMTGPTTGLDFNSLLPFMPYRINLAVTPANSERVYASIWGLSNGATKLYLYYYNGTNWILIFSGQGSYAKEWMGLAVSPVNPDEYYFYGKQGEGLMGSKSLTVSPTVKGQYSTNTGTYADGHVLEFQPNILNNPLLFYGHHGGISVGNTSPSGVPLWEKRNNGLANLLLWSFDDSEFHKDVIVAAKQDHYCDIYRGGQWFALPGGGDSYSVKTAKSNDSLFFGSAGDNNISRHNINNVTTNSEYSLIPYDIPSAPSKTYISKTFQIKSLPNTNHDFFTYSDLYRRKLAKPIASNDDPDHLWEVDSDIGKIQPLSWKRQLTEYDFCYTQPDHQYLTRVC